MERGSSLVGVPYHVDMAQYLLKNGADPNATTMDDNRTVLQRALLSSTPSVRLVEMLLDYGANVNADTGRRLSCPKLYSECSSH